MSSDLPQPTALLPHRPPILCIDRILALSADEAVCELEVRDGDHLVDGALWEGSLIEGLAQTAAALNGRFQTEAAGGAPAAESLRGLLVGLRGLTVTRRPRAGERVQFRVTLIKRLGPMILVAGEARCDDEVLAGGRLKFFVGPGA